MTDKPNDKMPIEELLAEGHQPKQPNHERVLWLLPEEFAIVKEVIEGQREHGKGEE